MLVDRNVSIIIPCKTVGEHARESITHCQELDYPDYEIMVLPDEASGLDMPRVREIATGPIGPAEKRDIAADLSENDILAFIDDDAYPDRQWLRKAMVHFEDGNIAAVGGPGITPPDDSLSQKAGGRVFSSFIGSGTTSFRNRRAGARDIDDCPSSNLIIRKSVFQEIGGFDTNFWPGEDTKLCMDVTSKLKKRIRYDPEVFVYHHRRRLFKPHIRQVWNYAVHRGNFAKKLPDTSRRPLYFLPSAFVAGIVLGSIAAMLHPVLSYIYFSVLGLYLLLVLITSVTSSRDIRIWVLVFAGIITTHLTYGIGFIKGLLSTELER
ncbi:glycosyltransferase family 2 protein [Chloroflexota bacterium]